MPGAGRVVGVCAQAKLGSQRTIARHHRMAPTLSGSWINRKLDKAARLPGHYFNKLNRLTPHWRNNMPVKYGVIGCGAIAQRRHIPECLANPDSLLIGIADANQLRCDELGKKYGVKSFCDHKELLQMKELD